MNNFDEEEFFVTNKNGHKLSCTFHRQRDPYKDEWNREHVVIVCHGYLSEKNANFFPELSSDLNQYHSLRFDFHGCGKSDGREQWDYGGYEDEVHSDLRFLVEYLRDDKKHAYFIRGLVGHSRGGTNILLYASFYDDIPLIVNIAGRYRLDQGIRERFTKKQFDELDNNGYFIIKIRQGTEIYRITKEGINKRCQLDMSKIEQIKNSSILNIWGDKDDIVPKEDVYLLRDHTKNARKSDIIIIEGGDHCFKGKESQLIRAIHQWIEQRLES
ncbi:unnamed protein product [Didymodactylos carnosus]|uniref:AB hydrolase-1 domain-containing protein n=1 Tax=Didymodactylos carnosus TaxID=1234261 RepID=A0A814F575_9BILA|nr:unnamed protein product [Didymodactylos carnosus]CAF0976755.1 unnamed protein product [Didymodactylos carnosus]CAF3571521.1 unnamed protein product [Didymodactylos carnosus]CAF3749599.1 unnamed protein product [Didymodactylos carnosus]